MNIEALQTFQQVAGAKYLLCLGAPNDSHSWLGSVLTPSPHLQTFAYVTALLRYRNVETEGPHRSRQKILGRTCRILIPVAEQGASDQSGMLDRAQKIPAILACPAEVSRIYILMTFKSQRMMCSWCRYTMPLPPAEAEIGRYVSSKPLSETLLKDTAKGFKVRFL